MPLMRSITACFAPSPTASIAITEPTPITMPSSVSAVRKRFARSARPAALPASTKPRSAEPAVVAVAQRCERRRARRRCAAGPRSCTIAPVADLDHAMRVRGDFLRVRDDDDGVALARQLVQQRQHFDAALAVERAGRLVGEDDLAAVHQRARDRHALLLAARELVGLVLEALGEAERARAALRRARGARRRACRRRSRALRRSRVAVAPPIRL